MFGTGGDANARMELVSLKQKLSGQIRSIEEHAKSLQQAQSDAERAAIIASLLRQCQSTRRELLA